MNRWQRLYQLANNAKLTNNADIFWLNAKQLQLLQFRDTMFRIEHKHLCTIALYSQIMNTQLVLPHKQAPTYQSPLCSPLSAVTTCRQLRPATQGDLDYPRTRTVTYGSRAFAVSGPTRLKILPSSLTSLSLKPAHVCKQLKTILISQPS